MWHQVAGWLRSRGSSRPAQRAWAGRNPQAIMRTPVTIEDYLASPYVVEPLHLLDYCLVNDGGVALIIAEAECARRLCRQPVYIETVGRQDLNRGATSLRLLESATDASGKLQP